MSKTPKTLRAFYTATKNNEVFCFGANLKTFHEDLKSKEPLARGLTYYNDFFKKNIVTHFANENRQIVVIQKLK
jgi:hypothetical protein